MIKKVGRYVTRVKKPKMADDSMFTANLDKVENLKKLQAYCQEHGIGLVMQCINIPEAEASGLREFLRNADVFAEVDAL